MAGPVHYELYVRRTPASPWLLDCATEERARLTETADQLMEQGCAAVRATKETFDTDTGQFSSVVLFSRGEVQALGRSKTPVEERGPLCLTPQDLYTVHAREKIGRLLEGWLKRRVVTAFELLHRPDLLEQLEASGVELQHALQKVAIPEAQGGGPSVHEVIRRLQGLIDRSIARVRKDAKGFAALTPQTFAAEAERLGGAAEPLFALSGGVALALSEARSWRAKVGVLVELAEAAPPRGRARALALAAIEPPLTEILGAAGGVNDLFGAELDMGGALAALACVAAPREAQAIRAADASAARALPSLTPEAQRLCALMALGAFDGVRSAIGRRVLSELNGPRRLRPDDAAGEILLLRALAMLLTASAGRLLPPEDVQAAFVERSKRLVAADFVESFVTAALAREGADALTEVRALVQLTENVAGVMNKRAAARWLSGALFALRFEKDLRASREGPSTRLRALADLYRSLGAAQLPDSELGALRARIGEAGGWVEADAHLCALLAASATALPTRCLALACMAMGESAPPGAAADRAGAELLKLMRDPAARACLTQAPEAAARVRDALAAKAA